MKVFQIGFNKCGTSSIWQRLDALGLQKKSTGRFTIFSESVVE